jgi:seryl-tRNA synthetase
MIDIKEIRENPQRFQQAAKNKNINVDIDRLMAVDAELLSSKQRLQELATEKNRIGKSIPKLAGEEKQNALAQLAKFKADESQFEEKVKQLQPEADSLMLLVAQPADDSVPLGKDDTENVELRREGQVPQFDFKLKDHMQLGADLGIIDVERGVKLAGTRSYFLKGNGARLHWAVLQFAMDVMISKGYTPMSVPLLMKDEAMRGTGYYPGSEEQTYRMERDVLQTRSRRGRQRHLWPVQDSPVRQGRTGRNLQKQRRGKQQIPRGDSE